MSNALELANRAFEVFNRDFGRGSFEFADEDVRAVFVEEPRIVPMRAALEGNAYEGPTALADFAAASAEVWERLRVEVETARELSGNQALMVGNLVGVGRESGVQTSAKAAWLVQSDGERITAILTFPGEREALEAAA